MSEDLLRSCNVVCVALAAALLGGCLSVRPLDPTEGPVELADDEGILVVHVETTVRLDAVSISGETVLEDLPPGDHFRLVAAPAGSYAWDEVERTRIFRYRYLIRVAGERVRVTVRPGAINYPGKLVVVGPDTFKDGGVARSNWKLLWIRVLNRAAMALEVLEFRHPGLVARFPVRYGGPGRDAFLTRYQQAQQDLPGAEAAGSLP